MAGQLEKSYFFDQDKEIKKPVTLRQCEATEYHAASELGVSDWQVLTLQCNRQ